MSTIASTDKKLLPLALLSALAFVGIVVVNGLANALPLNGANTGVLSDEIPNLFVPTGLTFSIWGLIYLLLAGYVVALLKEARRGGLSAWTGPDALLFLTNAAANIGWIFAWHWRMVGLAMALMLVILGSLIGLERRNQKKLDSGGALYPAAPGGQDRGQALRRFFLTVPVRVYLGWISVATIANATALLVKTLGWPGDGSPFLDGIGHYRRVRAGLGLFLVEAPGRGSLGGCLGLRRHRRKAASNRRAHSTPVWVAALAAALLILLSFLPGRLSCPFKKKNLTKMNSDKY
jgi:hypothetical protein